MGTTAASEANHDDDESLHMKRNDGDDEEEQEPQQHQQELEHQKEQPEEEEPLADDDGSMDMDALIENQQWDQVMTLLQASPQQAQRIVNPSLGWTKLHWLCSIGSSPAPTELIAMVARLYPAAITMPDNRYGDTPLHIVCRSSVTNDVKLRILLSHIIASPPFTCDDHDDTTTEKVDSTAPPPPLQQLPPVIPVAPPCQGLQQRQHQGLLIRNRFGATALHSACNHNAVLGVIQALVQCDARIVRVTTHDGVHAISALYTGYVQTIPGTMAVARILRGEGVLSCNTNDAAGNSNISSTVVPPPPTDTTTTATALVQAETDDTTNTNGAVAPQQQQTQQQQLQQTDPSSPAAHFERFWKKVEYLATAVYMQSKNSSSNNNSSSNSRHGNLTIPTLEENIVDEKEQADPDDPAPAVDRAGAVDSDQQYSRFVLHGLLQSHGVAFNFYQLALKWNPRYAEVVDDDDDDDHNSNTGNLPLHILLERRPFRLYERQAIQATLQAYPPAAAHRNTAGDLPLLIAVRNKIPWHNGLDLIAQASPVSSTSAGRDVVTGLWPFQLAASVGGRVAVETTFELLKKQPDLLSV